MIKRIFFAGVLLLTAGVFVAGSVTGGYAAEPADQVKALYHCPMHPDYVSDKPGRCPICGMDLVKINNVPETSMAPAAATSPVPMKDSMGMDYVPVYEQPQEQSPGVEIDAGKQQLIGVRKDRVQKRPLTVEISTVGKVAYDPDLYVAQEEYIQALKTEAATRASALASIREQSRALVASSEKKLLLLGMSPSEVAALKNNGAPQDNLYFPVNSGKAWIYMTVYEYEMGLVKEGQDVTVEAVAFPGEIFKGKVAALTPVLDAQSRSVRVRAEVDDKDGRLKPEMFVNARISVDLGEQLAVPKEAVMDSGTRKIVYVVDGDHFTARDVTVRPAGDYDEVLSGLEEGEEIVTSGNFLIDSESRLKGAL